MTSYRNLTLPFPFVRQVQDREGTLCVRRFTVDDDRGGGAASLGHDVLRHTGVVCRVREAGLFDDQIVIDGDVEVPVICRVDDLLVL